MKDKKEDEDEISINSERNESEEKSVSEKIKNHTDLATNLVVNATFSRRNSLENLNNYDNQSLISNQINSSKNMPTFGSLHTKSKSFTTSVYSVDSQSYTSNYLQSTVPNSNFLNMNFMNNPKILFSPQKYKKEESINLIPPLHINQITLSDNKYSNKMNYNDPYFNEEIINSELKKKSVMLKLKDKELKDMMKNYESIKNKLTESKKKLTETKEYYEHVKKSNSNLKKLICGIIKYKHDNI